MRVHTTAALQRAAEAAVETARGELEAARSILRHPAGEAAERIAIKAPVSGSVLKIARASEGMVQTGEPLLEIGDPQRREVVTEVLSADAVRILPGMTVLFERWGGGDALQGRVRRVEPVGFTKISALGVEEQRVLVVADFTSDPAAWRRLGDGYRVESRFVLWQADSVLQVPSSALFRHGEGWAAFVVQDGKARRRDVNVGERNGLMAQIVSGLTEGERVVTHPDLRTACG